ncbi:phage structural protein [Sporosarcina newyorkensis]|uniref:DUF3277 domain-containing protein n=1 Tax=Sporosarcina newyorkensis TaxID=759851 RepID=A0A1T4YTM6_9BACL|nr:phage protein [Sporosarcina newyorkensis]SKB05112.1 Protein of unknown function [Sporosarcina newyorkensis]
MSVNTYDPLDTNVVVNNTILTGFADGTFINVERDEESYTAHVGAKGEVARARNANKMGKITVTLSQDSPSNSILSKMARGKDTFSVSVVDQNFGSTSGGNDCWIEKPPNLEFGKEISEREWIIVVPVLEIDE